ncbi:MAG: hypothetical protein NW216_00135 [Hyphomicrobium sp.]|nr:hypothetical protein [Hyphomicrobium sp.]
MPDVLLWNGGNGAFNVANSWNNLSTGSNPSATAPGSLDFAIITGTDGQVISGPGAAGFMEILASTTFSGTFTVSGVNEFPDNPTGFQVRDGKTATFGSGSTLTVTNENAVIGFSQLGHLVLNGGADMSVDVTENTASMYIGGAGGNGSTVTVDGVGTTLTLDSGLLVGGGANGSLTLANGGLLDISADNGFGFYVAGTGGVTGTLNVNTGADITNTGFSVIGQSTGSTGTVIVENLGTSWSDVSIAIGFDGTGSLTLREQATITTAALTLGTVSGSGTLSIMDASSALTVTSAMAIGGATSDGGSGTVTVSNSGALSVGETLTIWGDGTLNITTAGTVQVGTPGTTVAGAMRVQTDGLVQGTGTINAPVVNNGELHATDFDTALADKVLTVNGNISGTGTIKIKGDATLQINGTVSASQTVNFDDTFADSFGTLHFLAGAVSGFDGVITNFDSQDRIRIASATATTATFDDTTNVLTVFNGLSVVTTLALSDANDDDDFTVTSDGAGGVVVEVANKAPVITSGGGGNIANIQVRENLQDPAYTILAADPDNDDLTYTIIGGPDQDDLFIAFNDFDVQIEFFGIPNFEMPADSNGDNIYEVIVQVSDGRGGVDTQTVRIEVLDNINPIDGGSGNDFLEGRLESETLRGFGGNDTLDGGFEGSDDDPDTLEGGLGNDLYYLGNGNDVVIDTGGVDTIRSSIGRNLASYPAIENLVLTGSAVTGTGNNLANVITGNTVGNLLDGSGLTDTLNGGLGNDTYVLSSGSDVVTDTGGTDTITTTMTRSLASYVAIERLTLVSGNINGTGNGLANVITGSTGNNLLDGGALTDTLNGGLGNDTYVLASGSDVITDTGGIDTITTTITRTLASFATVDHLTLLSGNINGTGNALANVITGSTGNNILDGAGGNDSLVGGAGNDTLKGGTGNDTLAGGAGSDVFVFNTQPTATNRDTISDFSNAGQNDVIHLENTGAGLFTLLAAGALTAAAFKANATGTATEADDRVIYNTATGALFYDTNGNGAGGATQFAMLSTRPTITAADFFVI